jgi:hypothetical protein
MQGYPSINRACMMVRAHRALRLFPLRAEGGIELDSDVNVPPLNSLKSVLFEFGAVRLFVDFEFKS